MRGLSKVKGKSLQQPWELQLFLCLQQQMRGLFPHTALPWILQIPDDHLANILKIMAGQGANISSLSALIPQQLAQGIQPPPIPLRKDLLAWSQTRAAASAFPGKKQRIQLIPVTERPKQGDTLHPDYQSNIWAISSSGDLIPGLTESCSITNPSWEGCSDTGKQPLSPA